MLPIKKRGRSYVHQLFSNEDGDSFDYVVFNIIDGLCGAFVRVDYICVDFAAFWSASTEACHARGLAHSAPLGGSRTQHRSGARALSTARGLDVTSLLRAKAHAHDLRVHHRDFRLSRQDLRLHRHDLRIKHQDLRHRHHQDL
jgi:hypothetical protein